MISAALVLGSVLATGVIWSTTVFFTSNAVVMGALSSIRPTVWFLMLFAPYLVFMVIDAASECGPASVRYLLKPPMAQRWAGKSLLFAQLCLTWIAMGFATALVNEGLVEYPGVIAMMAVNSLMLLLWVDVDASQQNGPGPEPEAG